MPRAADLYGAPPFYYHRRDELVITYRTDAASARAWIPDDMEVDERPKALLRFVRQKHSPFGGYTGAYLSVLGTWRGTRVAYMIVGAKNAFAGTAAGREIWGMPLSVCDIGLDWHEEQLVASVTTTAGTEVCRCVATLTTPMDTARFASGAVAEGLFLRPARSAGARPALVRTVHTAEGAAPADTAWSADVTVRLRTGSAREPWDALPAADDRFRAAYVVGGRSVLDHGTDFEL